MRLINDKITAPRAVFRAGVSDGLQMHVAAAAKAANEATASCSAAAAGAATGMMSTLKILTYV
jgi:hypothetical protein